MSVIDRNIIDFAYVDDGKITLCISDHIPWEDDLVQGHLEILQEKINDYLDFITSGQIYEQYGDNGNVPNIKIIFCYKTTNKVEDFLNKAKCILNQDGYGLEWIYRPLDVQNRDSTASASYDVMVSSA